MHVENGFVLVRSFVRRCLYILSIGSYTSLLSITICPSQISLTLMMGTSHERRLLFHRDSTGGKYYNNPLQIRNLIVVPFVRSTLTTLSRRCHNRYFSRIFDNVRTYQRYMDDLSILNINDGQRTKQLSLKGIRLNSHLYLCSRTGQLPI